MLSIAVCFLIMPLVYIIVVMIMSGIKRQGAYENKALKKREIKKIMDEKKKVSTAAVAKTLRTFLAS